MAVVNVELSEYDALRESLRDYKERAEKLDNELSGLKKGENVIVTTKYCVRKVENIEELIRSSIETLRQFYANYAYLNYSNFFKFSEFLKEPEFIVRLSEVIRNAFAHSSSFCGIGNYEVKQSSTEVQGYNDLRLVIENKLKEEAKAEIDSLKQSYIDKKKEYEKKYSEIEDKFEEEYKNKFKQFENTIEDKDKTIVDLQTKLSEKTASLNDTDKKLIESIRYKNDYFDMKVQNERLNEKIETLTKELEKAKNSSLLSKIFKW